MYDATMDAGARPVDTKTDKGLSRSIAKEAEVHIGNTSLPLTDDEYRDYVRFMAKACRLIDKVNDRKPMSAARFRDLEHRFQNAWAMTQFIKVLAD